MILKYFTDNDLYKFTTMNAVQKMFPNAVVKYGFVNRNNTEFPKGFAEALRKEVDQMINLYLSKDEEDFILRRCYFFEPIFIDLLKGFRYNPQEVTIRQTDGKLEVEIEGLWYRTVLWEVPLMALICELYYQMTGQNANAWENKAANKGKTLNEMNADFSDFGTRRRFSFEVHDKLVEIMKREGGYNFKGTSNVYLAMKHDTIPMGTHPHEWFMYHGAHFGYRMANAMALENWVNVYQGSLGIALTDTYTTDNFFLAFSTKYAKLFDGIRWDSGDAITLTEKAIAHYKKYGINPVTKTIVYSDALDLEKVKEIKKVVNNRIHDVYGIGTYFTNDVGAKPLNIVIKLFASKPTGYNDFIPTVKLSDVSSKHTGSKEEIELCLKMIDKK